MKPGMEAFPLRIVPGLHGLVAGIDKDRFGVPVLALAGQIVAALQKEDALPGFCETPGHCAAAWPGTDNNGIVMVAHEEPLR